MQAHISEGNDYHERRKLRLILNAIIREEEKQKEIELTKRLEEQKQEDEYEKIREMIEERNRILQKQGKKLGVNIIGSLELSNESQFEDDVKAFLKKYQRSRKNPEKLNFYYGPYYKRMNEGEWVIQSKPAKDPINLKIRLSQSVAP